MVLKFNSIKVSHERTLVKFPWQVSRKLAFFKLGQFNQHNNVTLNG